MGSTDDVWAILRNPSGLSHDQRPELSLSYSPAQFGLRELALTALVYAHPTDVGTIAVSASRFGFELYNETTVSFTYSNTYHNAAAFGFTIRYHRLGVTRYGTAGALGIDAGLLITTSELLTVGFAVRNLNGPTIGQEKEPLPRVYSTGITYRPFKGFEILVDLEKDVRFPTSIKSGIEYRVIDVLALRTGFATEPSKASAGAGIQHSRFGLDYAVQIHPDLGLTHQFSISISFGRL